MARRIFCFDCPLRPEGAAGGCRALAVPRAPKQKALGSNIGRLTRLLQQLDIDYHVGIISTDVGTNTAPGTPWGGVIGVCDSYEGDDGVGTLRPAGRLVVSGIWTRPAMPVAPPRCRQPGGAARDRQPADAKIV